MGQTLKRGLEARLVEGRWLSRPRLEAARQESERSGHSLWYCLVKLRLMSQEEVMEFLACESGVPYVRVQDYPVREDALSLLEPAFCIDNTLFPLFPMGNTLYIASGNPFDASLADACRRMSGMEVELLLSTATAIRCAQDAFWNLEERMFSAHELVSSPRRLRGVVFYRETERFPVTLAVTVTVADGPFTTSRPASFNATTTDISRDARAAGLVLGIFLPPKLPIYLDFKLPSGSLSARGEVLNCRMEQGLRYLCGVSLKFKSEAEKERILKVFTI